MRLAPTPILATLASVAVFTAFTTAGASAQPTGDPGRHPLADYQFGSAHIPQTPSVSGGAVGAFVNPAAWATGDRAELAFWWNDRSARRELLDNWGVSVGRHLGFAMQNLTVASPEGWRRVTDYQIGLARGDRRGHLGLAWRFPGANESPVKREQALVVGAITRPAPWLSYGMSGAFSTRSGARLGVADVGVRPLGKPWLTLFADYSWRDGQTLAEGGWGAGAEVRPLRGLHLGAKLREASAPDDFRFSLNLGVTFGFTGAHVLPDYGRDGDRGATTYLVRIRPPYQGLPTLRDLGLDRRPRYALVDLENRALTYQNYRWFDQKRVAWLDLSRRLERIRRDQHVSGVALNIAGMKARSSLLWELGEQVARLREAGKEIVIHADRLTMPEMRLAAVADRLTLDPQGWIELPGLALKRTYMKETLDKLGLGFQELRYFPYKSAVEVLSRTEMSPGEREQRQRLVDVLYEEWRAGICAGRNLGVAQFDSLVDNATILGADEAKAAGLVDDLARWPDLKEWLHKERDGARADPSLTRADARAFPDERWGRPPTIAVVYAVGECAMDEGIKGRATSAHLRRLARDPNVRAVVLRADSPGGDPLPSDLVAAGVDELIAKGKPVVVTQGDVAASGGYWISMNGSRVLTTPVTITGSIGVIAGWVYDDGLSEKLGLSADGIQRGAHADLMSGVRLPLLGLSLPTRPLDDGELARIKQIILDMYDQFVARVARARGLDPARVRELGGGRVWMGHDAVEHDLCDGIGGLTDAIALARELSGLAPEAEVLLAEYPSRRMFEWPKLPLPIPRIAKRAEVTAEPHDELDCAWPGGDYGWWYLNRVVAAGPRPLALTPPDWLP